MKKLFFLPFFSLLLTVSCSNSSGSAKESATDAGQTATSSNATQGKYGTFTFTSNGKQRTFAVWHKFYLSPLQTTSGSIDAIMLEDGGPSNAGFDFKINKQATTEFKTGYANNLIPGLLFDFFDTTGVSYTGDGMVVNVTSLSANKLTGTFSGRFVKEKYQIKENASGNVPQVIEVTVGKFDLQK